jgi:hypothetical protein
MLLSKLTALVLKKKKKKQFLSKKKQFLKKYLFSQKQKNFCEKKRKKIYRALPRGNTSSGNTKRSCGWS